jgi:hypothetical protein
MNSAYVWRLGVKAVMAWSTALLLLAVMVSTASADPTEVLVYQFDPASDSLSIAGGITDRSGNNYNGTAISFFGQPNSMKIVPGHLSSTFAVQMAGDDGFPGTGIWTGITAKTAGIWNGPFTVMAWTNRNNLHAGDQMVFGTTGVETVGSALHLGFRNFDTYMGFWGNDSHVSAAPTPVANAWHHVAWRYDPATKNQDIFIDGVLANSDGGHGPFNHNQPLLIGRTVSNNGAFAGLLEYPRVFNVALSDGQINNASKDLPIGP